jgi:hypothetical protein
MVAETENGDLQPQLVGDRKVTVSLQNTPELYFGQLVQGR